MWLLTTPISFAKTLIPNCDVVSTWPGDNCIPAISPIFLLELALISTPAPTNNKPSFLHSFRIDIHFFE